MGKGDDGSKGVAVEAFVVVVVAGARTVLVGGSGQRLRIVERQNSENSVISSFGTAAPIFCPHVCYFKIHKIYE